MLTNGLKFKAFLALFELRLNQLAASVIARREATKQSSFALLLWIASLRSQ